MLSLLAYSHYVAHYVTRREILKALNLDAIVVSSSHNFAWLTCGGRNYVNMSVEGIILLIFNHFCSDYCIMVMYA
jgi:hypothetical protein